jgi:hypothetical protein
VGSKAEIHLPKLGFQNLGIEEGGQAIWGGGTWRSGVAGVAGARETATEVVVDAGSGDYRFVLKGK